MRFTNFLFISALTFASSAFAGGVTKIITSIPEMVDYIKVGKSVSSKSLIEVTSNGKVSKQVSFLNFVTRYNERIAITATIETDKVLDRLVIAIYQKADPKLAATYDRVVSTNGNVFAHPVYEDILNSKALEVAVGVSGSLKKAGIPSTGRRLEELRQMPEESLPDSITKLSAETKVGLTTTNTFGRSIVEESQYAISKNATPEEIENVLQAVQDSL